MILAESLSFAELQSLVEQTCKLRRDPEQIKGEIIAAEKEDWIEKNQDAVFVFKGAEGEESFSISDFL